MIHPTRNPGVLLRPVLTLLSGAVVGQAIAYGARPLLTRLFTPEAFGLLGFYLALTAVIARGATGRYEDAVMLPEQDDAARHLVVLSVALSVVAALLTLPLAFFPAPIAGLFRAPGMVAYLPLVPLGVLAQTWMRLGDVWLTRRERYRAVSYGRLVQNGTAVPIQLLAGWMRAGAGGLIGGLIGGWSAATLYLTFRAFAPRGGASRGAGLMRGSELRRLARRYRDFPRFALPSSMLNAASQQLPAFVLLFFFTSDVLGHYAIAFSVLAVPLGLLGTSASQVFFVKAVEARRGDGLRSVTTELTQRLLSVGLFPIAAVAVAGPDLFQFVFGDDWRESGHYARLLAPWVMAATLAGPLSRLFDVFERQRAELAFNVASFLARLAALVAGGLRGDPTLAVGLYGAVGLLFWGGMAGWMLRWGDVPARTALHIAGRYVAMVTLPLLIVLAAWLADLPPVGVFGATVGAGLLYLGLLWRLDGRALFSAGGAGDRPA